MSQEEVLNRVQELNNKFAEDTITDEELKDLYHRIDELKECVIDEMYHRKLVE